jgi:DNA-binding NarL/FixJ family response regulator
MIRALLVADIRLYREGLAEILSRTRLLEVVGTASSLEEAFTVARDSRPDVVLIDTAMPGSLTAIGIIVSATPGVNVVALGVPDNEADVITCAEAGVSGYVFRDSSLKDLIEAVKAVVRGELRCSPQMARSLLRHVKALAAARSGEVPCPHLTRREIEIAELLDHGLSNKEIASRLCIEVSTVKNHVHSILEKLNASRRGEAAAKLRQFLVGRTLTGQPRASITHQTS